MTADLKCPHCGGQAFTDYGDGLVACQRCYTQFDLNRQQCPHCGALMAEGTVVCLQCGADSRGDLARRIIRERLMTPDDRRRARLPQVQRVRTDEEEASHQRLEAWWEDDQRQREAARQERLARQRRERHFLVIALIVILAVALFVALISLILVSSTEPTSTPTAWLTSCKLGIMQIAFSTGSLYTCGLTREIGFDGVDLMVDNGVRKPAFWPCTSR